MIQSMNLPGFIPKTRELIHLCISVEQQTTKKKINLEEPNDIIMRVF